jgi:hypothetical protein
MYLKTSFYAEGVSPEPPRKKNATRYASPGDAARIHERNPSSLTEVRIKPHSVIDFKHFVPQKYLKPRQAVELTES